MPATRSNLSLFHWPSVLCALSLLAFGCGSGSTPTAISFLSPAALASITTCSVELQFELSGDFSSQPTVLLNLAALPVPLTEAPAGTFRATLSDQDLGANNMVSVEATRASDGTTLREELTFAFAPNAHAYEITQSDQLITGPLAHNRLGDFMLESCSARFAIQAGAQRDLYSVGQFGGNLIDAERIDRPGLDNFLEVQVMANVETVINAQTVVIVNDGGDGNAAALRACGPDDLLDFVNPSSQVTDLGIAFPAGLNDLDQTIEGCTDYSISASDSHIRMDTTFTNLGGAPVTMLTGDWMNQGGELDVLQTPNVGVGPALTNDVGTMGFFGFDEARGVDYAYTSTPESPGSYVVISGVTVVLHSVDVVAALLGLASGVTIEASESYTMTRYFGVGDGSGSNAVDLEVAIKGTPNARLEGCVSVAGVPAAGAIVTVGEFGVTPVLTNLITSFVTDDDGCYAGSVPVPDGATSFGVAAAKTGVLYEGSGAVPLVTDILFMPDATHQADFDLPETGAVQVSVTDESDTPLPSRINIVGFDQSPPLRLTGPSLPGFGGSTLGVFESPDDSLPFGIVHVEHAGASGVARFDLEPGSYQVVVSRGTEYSIFRENIVVSAGATTMVDARIAAVLDTAGFVSSDFHVHGIHSADSRVSHAKRVLGFASEGVDNIIMTDHHVHTDLDPTIAALGLGDWVSATIGEEITTFDYGHFNAYPFTVDPSRISGGSTDWAIEAPPGFDFPSAGSFNATPAGIFSLATTGATATPSTTVQINHISSHFGPLKIDTSVVPPQDGLDAAARLERRLDAPISTNLFFPFPALELWNGNSSGHQRQFLDQRIGIWFNLLNQGIETTFIADTDSHRHTNLGMAGARTWTAAAPGSDVAGTVDPAEVATMVDAGRAIGGQGIFVTAVLRATDGSGAQADFSHLGSTHMSDAAGNVELDIRVQSPEWAAWDTIEVYHNATTTPLDIEEPYLYGATPSLSLTEGDCDALTTSDGDFDVAVVPVGSVPGANRLETSLTLPFNGLGEDTWFVVVVRGSDGSCEPMFPVYPSGLSSAANTELADLIGANVGEGGTFALGATNALYYQMPTVE